MMRLAVTLAGLALSLALPAPASASKAEREEARLIMLDDCVVGSATRENADKDFTAPCRCASKKTAKELSDEQIAGVISAGKLRGQSVRVWNDAMAVCKKG